MAEEEKEVVVDPLPGEAGLPADVTEEQDDQQKKRENRTKEGVGSGGEDPETQLTILKGDEMAWSFDKTSGKWYVSYGLPDSDRSLLFEASPEQMDALFGEGRRPVNYTERRLERLLRGRNSTFGGNISEMEGKGRFEDEVRRVKALALDNGVLPEWAESTGEVMDIIYIAQSEGKSQDWVLDQISFTEGFKQRFPGIKKLMASSNLTLAQGITGFLEFEAGVRAAVKGIGGRVNAVTPEVVGGLLNRGYDMNTVVETTIKFDRMKNFRPALRAFNSILESQGKEPVRTMQDMFDFVSGKAPADTYAVWEASSLAEAAAAAGLGDVFTAEQAMKVAVATEGQTSLGDATQMFQSAAQLLLRFRHEVDVGAFGIDQDDIISMSLGQPPPSGTSAAELQESMNRAVLAAQGNLQGRVGSFKQFRSDGAIQAAGLSGLRTQS